MCPPVMICGFNRPDCLREVFEKVREAKPAQLFLVLDAPREGRAKDVDGVAVCRKIFENVDWPCEVHRNYAERNMGCRMRMSSGITWMFEHVDTGIILEDDCVPDATFFPFCKEMLTRYAADTRIGSVVGMIEHPYVTNPESVSYYFDRFPGSCGLATWKRAWQRFDACVEKWPRLSDGGFLGTIFRDRRQIRAIYGRFYDAYSGRIDSWATLWWLTNITENFLTIHPTVNLITNIGYEGTHNSGKTTGVHDIELEPMRFPLVHPAFIMPNARNEAIMCGRYSQPSLMKRIANKFIRMTLVTVGVLNRRVRA